MGDAQGDSRASLSRVKKNLAQNERFLAVSQNAIMPVISFNCASLKPMTSNWRQAVTAPMPISSIFFLMLRGLNGGCQNQKRERLLPERTRSRRFHMVERGLDRGERK